jgi:hypothetical protein
MKTTDDPGPDIDRRSPPGDTRHMTKKRHIDPPVRQALEDLGEATVRAKLLWMMNVTSLEAASKGAEERLNDNVVAPLWAIEQWLAEKEARRQWWVKAAAILAGGAVLITLFAWLSPKEPAPTITDPNYIYQYGSQIGHVVEFHFFGGTREVFHLKIDRSKKLNDGYVIEFHDIHCVIEGANSGEKQNSAENAWKYSYEGIACIR